MAKTRLVKNNKGQYGIYNPYTDQVTPITSNMSLVKNTRGKYGFKSGNQVFELDEMPKTINLEETFKKKSIRYHLPRQVLRILHLISLSQ